MVGDDEIQRRRSMTFAQAEGVEPLPRDLEQHELSERLRNRIWNVLYQKLQNDTKTHMGIDYIQGVSGRIIRDYFIDFLNRPVDEFGNDLEYWTRIIKPQIFNGSYIEVYGTIQFFCKKFKRTGTSFCTDIERVLEEEKAGYRLHDGDVLVPAASSQEADTITDAFEALDAIGRIGASAHLRAAVSAYNAGDHAGAVREAIHSVESVVLYITPEARTLGDGLSRLRRAGKTHPALRDGFVKLYGYTSDEQGIRHALVDKDSAEVHADEALFMIGACAAFVTYLLRQHEQADHA